MSWISRTLRATRLCTRARAASSVRLFHSSAAVSYPNSRSYSDDELVTWMHKQALGRRANPVIEKMFKYRNEIMEYEIEQLRKEKEKAAEGTLDGSPPSTLTSTSSDQPEERGKKSPRDSSHRFLLQFSKRPDLLSQYLNFYGDLRFGQILEDLDALAGISAYAHAIYRDEKGHFARAPPTIVTASCDRIDLLAPLPSGWDLRYDSSCTWVGHSSMEIRLQVDGMSDYKEESGTYSTRVPLVIAYFTMVARDSKTNKALPVPELDLSRPKDRSRFDEGLARTEKRRSLRKQSLDETSPTAEESCLIHNLFLESRERDMASKKGAEAAAIAEAERNQVTGYRWMKDTELSAVHICHPQQGNIHGKVFGGYLMRKAFELGWATAQLHTKKRPSFLSLDDTNFLAPVEIGSILKFSSKVVYAEGPPHKTLQVSVTADVIDPNTREATRTNTFQLTFESPASTDGVQRVMPRSYGEAIEYIEGKRHKDLGKEYMASYHANAESLDP